MKKIMTLLLVLCLICLAAASCAVKGNAEPESDAAAKQSPAAALSSQDKNLSAREASTQTSGVDVDLTALSSTMVYAEVYNIMASPDDYVGRTVKMSGPYYAQYYEETEQYYHFVIIEDAAACCQQGLEFVWNGEHSYPNDYPADTTRIEVTGVFDSYEELGMTYYHLVVNDVTVL